MKKRKLDDDDASRTSSKKQRTRVSFSCGECHRRKQKCDRQVPCSHCVARKVPELCKAYTPGKTDQDLSLRLCRLEQIIEMALPQFCTGSSSTPPEATIGLRRSISSGYDDTRSQTEEQEPTSGTFQSGKWYGSSASGSVAPAPVIEQLQTVGMLPDGTNEQEISHRLVHDSRNFDLAQAPSSQRASVAREKSLIEEDPEPSAADNLKSLVQECGVSPHKISELLQELPPSRSSDVLVDYYFSSM